MLLNLWNLNMKFLRKMLFENNTFLEKELANEYKQ